MSLAKIVRGFMGNVDDIRVEAYDGSRAGRADAPVALRVASPRALAYLFRAPGEIGLARAYVAGDLEVVG